MYLAWLYHYFSHFCAKLAQKGGFQALNPIIFAFLRNPLKFAALVAPDNGNDHSQEGINYYLFEFIIKKMIVYKNYSYRIAAKEVLH